jgi:hypothetical protein
MMKTLQALTCTAILGTAALVSAQPTPQPQPPQPPQTTSQAPQTTTQPPQQTPPAPPTADSIIVTGCLRNASSTPDSTGTTGTTGTAGSSATGTTGTATDPSQQKFVLMDATRGPAEASGTTTSTPDSPARDAKKDTYRLIANPTALAQHVGKKLELTGTLEQPSAAQDAGSGAFAGRPLLRVTSGKIVAASCEQQ